MPYQDGIAMFLVFHLPSIIPYTFNCHTLHNTFSSTLNLHNHFLNKFLWKPKDFSPSPPLPFGDVTILQFIRWNFCNSYCCIALKFLLNFFSTFFSLYQVSQKQHETYGMLEKVLWSVVFSLLLTNISLLHTYNPCNFLVTKKLNITNDNQSSLSLTLSKLHVTNMLGNNNNFNKIYKQWKNNKNLWAA